MKRIRLHRPLTVRDPPDLAVCLHCGAGCWFNWTFQLHLQPRWKGFSWELFVFLAVGSDLFVKLVHRCPFWQRLISDEMGGDVWGRKWLCPPPLCLRLGQAGPCLCVLYRFFFPARLDITGGAKDENGWSLAAPAGTSGGIEMNWFGHFFLFTWSMFHLCSVRRHSRTVLRFDEIVRSRWLAIQHQISLFGRLRRSGILQHRSKSNDSNWTVSYRSTWCKEINKFFKI